MSRSYFLVLFLLLMMFCNIQSVKCQEFDLQKVANRSADRQLTALRSSIFDKPALQISPEEGNRGIVVWEKGNDADWNGGKFLVFEVYDKAAYSGVISLEFYKENGQSSDETVLQGGEIFDTQTEQPWISCLIGVLPQLKTQVIFPLSYLDAQQIFLPRFPRQLKGTISGNRMDPNDITKVVIRFGPYDGKNYKTEYELASIAITSELPKPYPDIANPIIDPLGQRKDRDWPGKIKDEKDLIERSQSLATTIKNAQYPDEWGQFGGWKEKKFEATGFFRTQHDGSRWWLVDPEGYAFLSVGVDCIGASSSGPINGIEDLFEWLPVRSDSIFTGVLRENRNAKNVDFYVANLIRSYGKEWKNKWKEVTADLMRTIRMNTVGNWSDIDFARKSQIPYVLPLNGFPSTRVQIYRDFPDVFSEEYQNNAVKFASQLENFKDDPYLVGYFLRNEPQWAFGYHNLAYEMFDTTQQSSTKDEFVKWLQEKYNNKINAVNEKWKLQLAGFDGLKEMTFKDYPSDVAKEDLHHFSALMVRKYVDVPCDEVEKVDNNHLNLGMRYAWISSDLLYKAGERFDVFSINSYGLTPAATAEIAEKSGKPVMIGEFHHGAVDRALPATGITGVLSQDERATAYRNYVEEGFSRPELVGMHYFQWVDQPYTGRGDGENYNIGVVSTCNVPYPELTKAMIATNERIYEVATGKSKPFKAEIGKTPAIHY